LPRHKHVLVVDDDVDLRDSLRALLEAMNFVVATAGNAREAIAAIPMARPDVILSDIYMDGGDGFELLNEMQARGLGIPVVCMSGGSSVDGYDPLEVARRLGAGSSLNKPFQPDELVAALDAAIHRRAATASPI
jgi:DNA-binding NtrC family response regulator